MSILDATPAHLAREADSPDAPAPPVRPRRRLPARLRAYAYAAGMGLLSLLVVLGLSTWTSRDEVYAALTIAAIIGLLLTIRLAPNRPGAALVLVPAMAIDARLGLAALPAFAFAAVLANVIRGLRGPRLISTAAHLVLAFATAHVASQAVGGIAGQLLFAVVFALSRALLSRLQQRLDRAPMHPRAEQPELLLSLPLAPIGLLPIAVGEALGDGALLLAMAALLALLFVVREAANLATARAEVETERDRLARANALQDDLIHLITHELRNPLTLVMSYSQLAYRAASDESYGSLADYIGHIERAGRSIQGLMESLLQLSKLERSDALPPSEPVDVQRIIVQVTADLGPLAHQKAQTLRAQQQREVEPAMAVPSLLRDALSNLVSNAVKYTPEGGDIVVWAERGAEPRTVVVGVSDTGIGLSREDLDRLFTKFFRSSDPRVQRERGSGLGLALTQAMVVRMGGKITVASTPGEGTTFRLTLPAAG
jgi:signal transduction histidine kinase